ASTSACPRCAAGKPSSKAASTTRSSWAAPSATRFSRSPGPSSRTVFVAFRDVLDEAGELAFQARKQQHQLRLLHRRQYLAQLLDPLVLGSDALLAVGEHPIDGGVQLGIVGLRGGEQGLDLHRDVPPLGREGPLLVVV